MVLTPKDILEFQTFLRQWHRKNNRTYLPWRVDHSPYAVLVSEIMLQQTQVDRVIPKFIAWMHRFPSIEILAASSLSDVLHMWQGLGYNRRAKFLHTAACEIVTRYGGVIPHNTSELLTLSGIGQYTSSAIRIFGYNKRDVCIETNIRAVYIHHFFNNRNDVSDAEILSLVEQTVPTSNMRSWYGALMDYGTYLKKTLPNPSRKSKHHTVQSVFKGSVREMRGMILRLITERPHRLVLLKKNCALDDEERFQKAFDGLVKEGLIKLHKNTVSIV